VLVDPHTFGFTTLFQNRRRNDNDIAMRSPSPSPQNTPKITRIEEPVRPLKAAAPFAHDLFGRDGRGESFSTLRPAAL